MFATLLNSADLIQFANRETNAPSSSSKTAQNDDEDQYLDEMDNEESGGGDYFAKIKAGETNKEAKSEQHLADEPLPPKLSISTPTTPAKPLPTLKNLVAEKKSTKLFKLSEVTSSSRNEFNSQYMDELLYKTYKRVLNSEEIVSRNRDAQLVRKRIIVDLTTLPNYRNRLLFLLLLLLLNYITIKNNFFLLLQI